MLICKHHGIISSLMLNILSVNEFNAEIDAVSLGWDTLCHVSSLTQEQLNRKNSSASILVYVSL